jgi:hypothetical protein
MNMRSAEFFHMLRTDPVLNGWKPLLAGSRRKRASRGNLGTEMRPGI